MSQGDTESLPPLIPFSRRGRLIGLILVLTIGAGAAGWWLGLYRERSVRVRAAEAAREQCRGEAGSRLAQKLKRTLLIADIRFEDLTLVGDASMGGFTGTVEGDAFHPGAVTYHYRCTVTEYDASEHTWSVVMMSS
jgi:hypothetical protein